MKKLLLCVLLVCLCGVSAFADKKPEQKQKGYHFTFIIHGGTDTVMYLGNYYAGSTYAIDTARIDKKGRFVFARKDVTLPVGMYFFTNPGGNYVEFIVYREEPNFTFETSGGQWANNMKVTGSEENNIFFQYHRDNRRLYNVIDSAQKAKTDDEAYKVFYRQKQREADSIKMAVIKNHPDCMFSIMMNATRDPVVPSEDATGRKLSDRERYEYYIGHYFDNMALDNDLLVRTPDAIFHRRVMDYLDKNLKGASAEMMCQYIDTLIERSRPSKEVFKYLVHTLTEKYLQSSIMSYDAIYVHLVQKYFASGDNYWSAPSVIDEQVKRATTWDRLLVGRVAPELILKDTTGGYHSLQHSGHKYTLLIFWSPSCGHCKTMIPELYTKYNLYKDRCDIGTFAILSEPDEATRVKWKEFIREHHLDWLNLDGGEANIDWHEVYNVETTPQIYLLDKDSKILAKKLNADSFEEIIKIIEHIE